MHVSIPPPAFDFSGTYLTNGKYLKLQTFPRPKDPWSKLKTHGKKDYVGTLSFWDSIINLPWLLHLCYLRCLQWQKVMIICPSLHLSDSVLFQLRRQRSYPQSHLTPHNHATQTQSKWGQNATIVSQKMGHYSHAFMFWIFFHFPHINSQHKPTTEAFWQTIRLHLWFQCQTWSQWLL